MPDVFDRAQQRDLDMQDEIQRVATAPKRSMVAVGFCHHCGETVKPGHLFCDTECRDDYEKRRRLEAIKGG